MGESYYLSWTYRGFKNISVSEKILNTCFLLAIGIGYLAALSHMYLSYRTVESKAGHSAEERGADDHGSPEPRKLDVPKKEATLPGLNYSSTKEAASLPNDNGTYKAKHPNNIAPVLPGLVHFFGATEADKADRDASLRYPILILHVHLFGMAFILFYVGKIFLLCDLNPVFKRVMMVIPFVAMLVEVLAWFASRWVPGFAYIVAAGGALMGFSMGFQIMISIYQMWFHSTGSRPVWKKTLPR